MLTCCVADSPAALSRRVLEFFARLREEHGFSTGQREVHDALRALDLLGVDRPSRVRAAMRAVACASREQIAIFEALYEAVFLAADDAGARAAAAQRGPELNLQTQAFANAPAPGRAERRVAEDSSDAAANWSALRARYSPSAETADPPAIEARGLEEMESAARRFVRSVRLGRARRWRPQPHGPRFDVRRTLRASLQTGGDPAVLRRLGRPHRAPRIVLLVDGSRSMADYAPVLLQFAYALGRATRRARTYAFSTALHDVTRIIQAARPDDALPSFGEAWGGGTRIGASLARFVRDHGRMLDDQTLVIVASDGLDAGDTTRLERVMREIRRRSAGVVWLNPHARSSGFVPTASGMRSVAPFIDVLDAVADARDVARVAARVRREV